MVPRVFISYAWEDDDHKDWVRKLAMRLRHDGVESILDQWETVPGDQLPRFMETAVRTCDFVLIVCTPQYKDRSDKRRGGVGYEGDIMTGEVFAGMSRRKFIPVLRKGPWGEAAPSWLLGTYYVDLTADPLSEAHYSELVDTLLGKRDRPPAVQPHLQVVGDLFRAAIERLDIVGATGEKKSLIGKLLRRILVEYLGLPSLLVELSSLSNRISARNSP